MTDQIYNQQAYININGSPIDQTIFDKMQYLEVESTLGYPSSFKLIFNDASLDLIKDSMTKFAIGNALTIALNAPDAQNSEEIFDGEIVTIAPEYNSDYGATLVIMGYDKSHRLMRGTQTRAFLNTKDSDIASQIAGEASLSTEIDTTSIVYDHIIQDNQDNWSFLQQLARRNGYQMLVEAGKLYFRKPPTTQTVEVKWGESLTAFNARLSAARQVGEVIVRGWDINSKQAIVGQASRSTGLPATGISNTPGTLGFASATHIEVHQPVVSQSEANNLAQAILNKINGEFFEAEGTAIGNPKIVAGAIINIANIDQNFGGKYHVTNARHMIIGSQYTTEFRVEGNSPYLLGGILDGNGNHQIHHHKVWSGVYPAIVTNNDDPEALNRVKLKYPWFNDDVESHWARIISPGAGGNRGTHWLPEVDDEVLVMFEQGDFNLPYVIGGVYNGQDKSDVTSGSGNVFDVRAWKSRTGHIISMDDSSGSEQITFITQGGHEIILDDGGKKITVTSTGGGKVEIDDNGPGTLTVDGQGKIVIKAAQDVSIEGGTDVSVKGGINVKVEGVNIDVKGSGMVTIAGSLIKIG